MDETILEAVQQALEEAFVTIDEEDLGGLRGPRARAAATFWKNNWWRMVSNPGKGRYILQAHWRGLTEDIKDRDHRWLYENTRHSVHEDLRHEASEYWAGSDPTSSRLFGFASFVNVRDEKKAGGAVLPSLGTERAPQPSIQIAWKLPQPISWLTIGRPRPVAFPPRETGSTTLKWSKFFALDWGTYHVGVCREHSFEIFYKSERKRGLNGRYVVSLARIGGRTAWLIRKPEDQTPIAQRTKLERLMAELRRKRQRYLVWSDGTSTPKLYDVQKGELVGKGLRFRVLKRALKEGLVYGEVLIPGEEDSQGEFVTLEEVRQAAHDYLMHSRRLDYRHKRLLRPDEAAVVESWIAPVTFEWEGRTIKEGTWILGIKVFSDVLKKEIETEELNSFSIRGFAERV